MTTPPTTGPVSIAIKPVHGEAFQYDGDNARAILLWLVELTPRCLTRKLGRRRLGSRLGPHRRRVQRGMRHADTIGREPPDPTVGKRLNPAFVEWMMMLPQGWVTDVDISHTAQLRILGNGVVPPQAAEAFSMLGAL